MTATGATFGTLVWRCTRGAAAELIGMTATSFAVTTRVRRAGGAKFGLSVATGFAVGSSGQALQLESWRATTTPSIADGAPVGAYTTSATSWVHCIVHNRCCDKTRWSTVRETGARVVLVMMLTAGIAVGALAVICAIDAAISFIVVGTSVRVQRSVQ